MNISQMKVDGAVLKELAQTYGAQAKARELLESWWWPNGPICPHCNNAVEKSFSDWRLKAPARAASAQESTSVGPAAGNSRSPWGPFWNVPTFSFPSG
jgi:hypothetical protein